MAARSGRTGSLKARVLSLLQDDDPEKRIRELTALPARRAINPLFSFLLSHDEKVRWRAVTGMGAVTANLAERDREGARVIMRRLMWSLNDESGGIGWGAPESLAEIMARHEGLAEEFGTILASYVEPEGNYLEYEMLQRGLLWGIVRLARVRPELLMRARPHLHSYLESGDPTVRGLAAWALGLLGAEDARERLRALVGDQSELRFYCDDQFSVYTVGKLAEMGLALLGEEIG